MAAPAYAAYLYIEIGTNGAEKAYRGWSAILQDGLHRLFQELDRFVVVGLHLPTNHVA